MFRNLVNPIRAAIEIKQQERKVFRLLFLHSFLIGLASSLFFVDASRNFILRISIADMPSGYIVSGIAGYLLVRLFKTLQTRFGVFRSFELILFLFCVSMALLYMGRVYFDTNAVYAKLLAYTGFVLMFAFATLFAVGFAGICLAIFNLSQSKRLLALLGTGEIIASILGYLLIPVLVKALGGSIYLLLLSAVIALVSIVPIRQVMAGRPRETAGAEKVSLPPVKFNMAFIGKNPFILYLSLTTLFSIIAVYFIDYSYLISVRYFSILTGVEVATVVAMIFSVIKTGELFFSFFSASIVASSGMKRAVLLLPYLLIFGAVMGIISVIFFRASPVFMLFFLFLNKWTDRVIRKGVTIPSMKIMFQINTPEERVQLQTNIDGVISQVSTIICGVLLLVFCLFVKADDYNTFLSATTLVCLVVFVIFLLMSGRLFRIYKTRIQEFLHSKHTPAAQADAVVQQQVSGVSDPAVAEKLDILLSLTDLSDKQKIRRQICYYNPSAEPYSHFDTGDTESETEFIRKINKLYFDNQNTFSRTLIIAYFLCLDFNRQLSFFKDTYRVTPLRLRLYFLKGLCASDRPIPSSDTFYFAELVSQCINEILWTESAINDLDPSGQRRLIRQLHTHHNELHNLLLLLLQLLHDRKAVRLISDILHRKDKTEEDQLFAVELLENTLSPDIKDLVLPVFEPISYSSRKNKLGRTFFTTELDTASRLQDILMRDFNTVDNYTKQLALEALRETDPDRMAIKAFSESRIENLKHTAGNDEEGDDGAARKEKLATRLCKSLSLDRIDRTDIARWGIYNDRQDAPNRRYDRSKSHPDDNLVKIMADGDGTGKRYFEVDLLALALLSKTRMR